MEFQAAEGQQPVELFLKTLHSRMEFIKQHHLMFLHELGYTGSRKRRRRPLKKTNVKDLEVVENMIGFASPEAILKKPELLIKIFEECMRLETPLTAEARRLVREFLHIIDDHCQKSGFFYQTVFQDKFLFIFIFCSHRTYTVNFIFVLYKTDI